jgi:hypothetical protein
VVCISPLSLPLTLLHLSHFPPLSVENTVSLHENNYSTEGIFVSSLCNVAMAVSASSVNLSDYVSPTNIKREEKWADLTLSLSLSHYHSHSLSPTAPSLSPPTILTSSKNKLSLKSQKLSKLINYVVMVSLSSFIQILVLMRQMEYTGTQAGASKMSLLTVGAQAVMDVYLCLIHLVAGILIGMCQGLGIGGD